MNARHTPLPYARLGANHGYLIEGDVARIHADVEVLNRALLAGDVALQLWACESPHTGGPLSGVIVAEADVTGRVDATEPYLTLAAEAHARVPGGQRDYAMVLVIASGQDGHARQVHDFANYPSRQRFITPHLEGSVGYQIDGAHVVITADAVRSPRNIDNLSGSLSLELWALPTPYAGGSFEGQLLGRVDLGRLAGQDVFTGIADRVSFAAPSAGEWHVVMMLREWAGPAGSVTRDHAGFAMPYVVAEVTPSMDAPTTPVPPPPATETAASVTATPPEDMEPLRTAPAPAMQPPGRAESSPATASAPAAAAKRAAAGVSVNKATAEQLAAVKGLSKTLAREIVKGRPYASLDELLDVRGIGPKSLARLRSHITL